MQSEDQSSEMLLHYLEELGCFRRVLVVLIDSSFSFYCGPSGVDPHGVIVLGGYQVEARARSITGFDEIWPVTLYFGTEDFEASQCMLELFTPGNVLKVESNTWAITDGEFTLYMNKLASVEQVPDHIAHAFKRFICD